MLRKFTEPGTSSTPVPAWLGTESIRAPRALETLRHIIAQPVGYVAVVEPIAVSRRLEIRNHADIIEAMQKFDASPVGVDGVSGPFPDDLPYDNSRWEKPVFERPIFAADDFAEHPIVNFDRRPDSFQPSGTLYALEGPYSLSVQHMNTLSP